MMSTQKLDIALLALAQARDALSYLNQSENDGGELLAQIDAVLDDNPLKTDWAIDRLKTIADAVERMNAQEIDPITALEDIAGALYGVEAYADSTLSTIREAVKAWQSSPADDPVSLALETLGTIADELDADPDTARDDTIDAAHADPELNAVADLRTLADGIASADDTGEFDPQRMLEFSDSALAVVKLCDAYIGLRAQCPAGAVVVTVPERGNLG
jgi:hypothetical protein